MTDVNATRNLIALEDVMHSVRTAGPDTVRVLFEALRRHIQDEHLRLTLAAVQAIYNADPNRDDTTNCPHFAAKEQLADSAWDVITSYDALAEAPNYRIEGDTSVTGYAATFRRADVEGAGV